MSLENHGLESDDCDLTPFEKNRFFNGKLMTARDMWAEQQYHRRRTNTLTRFVVGAGLLCGLTVEEMRRDGNELLVTLGDGVALDCCGNPIVVTDAGETEAVRNPSDEDDEGRPLADVDHLYLYLSWATCDKDSVPVRGSENACKSECTYNRILETFTLSYETTRPDHVKAVPDVAFPENGDWTADAADPETYTDDEHSALLTTARAFYDDHLADCGDCDDERVFLGTFRQDEDGWTEVAPDDPDAVEKGYVYTNDLLYAALSRHVGDFDNPHEVSAGQIGALSSLNDVKDASDPPDGNIELVSGDDSVAIRTRTRDSDQSIDPEHVDLSVPRLRPLGRYLMDKALKCTLKHFAGVANRFAHSTTGTVADAIVEHTRETIESAVFEDDGPSEDDFLAFFHTADENGTTRKGFLDLGEDLDAALTDEESATAESHGRYTDALAAVHDRLHDGSDEPADALAVAAAQEVVCEAAERLAIDLVCVDFDAEDPESGQVVDNPYVQGGFTFSSPFEDQPFGVFSDHWPHLEDGDGRFEIQLRSQKLIRAAVDGDAQLVGVRVPTTFYAKIDVVVDANYVMGILAFDDSEDPTPVAFETTPRNLMDVPTAHTFELRAEKITGFYLVARSYPVVPSSRGYGVTVERRIAPPPHNLVQDVCIANLDLSDDEPTPDGRFTPQRFRDRIAPEMPSHVVTFRAVPDTRGMTMEEAETVLAENGWSVRVERRALEDVADPAGRGINDVLEQYPAPDDFALTTGEVVLTIVDSPSVERIDGIGDSYGTRLAEFGVPTLADLSRADVATVTAATGVSESRANDWIDWAAEHVRLSPLTRIDEVEPEDVELLVTERTFEDEDLRAMDPADIEERVTRLLDAGDVRDDVADRLRTVDWSGVRIGLDG